MQNSPFCTVLRSPRSRAGELCGGRFCGFMSVEEHKIVLYVIPESRVALKGLCKWLSTSRVHTQENGESRYMKI